MSLFGQLLINYLKCENVCPLFLFVDKIMTSVAIGVGYSVSENKDCYVKSNFCC